MEPSRKEQYILQELASEVMEITTRPQQQTTARMWRRLNTLRPERPMVLLDQVPGHEMDVNRELTLQTETPWAQARETALRRTLYRWRHMPVDMVVEPFISIPKVIHGADFGIRPQDIQAVTDVNNSVVGHRYLDQLVTEDDLKMIQMPQIRHDQAASAEQQAWADAIFAGIIGVRMEGMLPLFAPWDRIVSWKGAEQAIYDLIDRPDFIHQLMRRLTQAYHQLLDQLADQGLLPQKQSTIHCSGALTDELPQPGYQPEKPRPGDLWTAGMAQIFSTVSPAMHKEFEIDYGIPWYERFGLVYYGCCEPLHHKLDVIQAIPHLRKVSMSPWVDIQAGAEAIAGRYVYSCKPNPALLAGASWNPDAVREELETVLAACAAHKCPVEFILKDISTVRYQPQRLWEWAAVAMDVVQSFAR